MLTSEECLILFSELESMGWYWKENFIYAPSGSMWLRRDKPWHEGLRDFHDRMLGRCERMKRCLGDPKFENAHVALEETQDLVKVLAALIEKRT